MTGQDAVRAALFAACFAPGALAAQQRAQRGGDGFLFRPPSVSFNFRFGYDHALTSSDLFTFVTDQLTLDRGSFSSAMFAGDIGIRLTQRLDLVLGASYSGTKRKSEFRDYVDNNNLPIEQVTTFRRVPVTASLKWYALPRGRTVGHFAWIPNRYAPYVGAGAGVTWYRFEQTGDFIDFSTLRVFPDFFSSSGRSASVHAFAGLDVALTPHVALTGEARYSWARAPLDQDYVGFERLDLSGLTATGGLSFRF